MLPSHMTNVVFYRFLIEEYFVVCARPTNNVTTSRRQLSNKPSFFYFLCRLLQSGNEDPDEVLLDSEMDKVFAGSNARKEKFDVNTFQDNSQQPIGSRKKSSGKSRRKPLPSLSSTIFELP